MADNLIERLHTYHGQSLSAKDLAEEQAYHRDMRRRHNLGHHTFGIVVGLELIEQPLEGGGDAIDVLLMPGMAVDGYGREIVVMHPHKLDTSDFLRFSVDDHYEVWIGYEEEEANRAQYGVVTCRPNQFNRTLETFRVYIFDRNEYSPPDNVIVDGTEARPPVDADDLSNIPPDLSVPFQELPPDEIPRWLIPLGQVRWDGTQLVAAAAGKLAEGRSHVDIVAAELLAPGQTLIVRDRSITPLTITNAGVAVGIEGSLQVERDITAKDDVHVDGERLDFRQSDGSEGELYQIQRLDGENGPGTELQIQIGDQSDGENRLVVASGPNDLLVVRDNGDTSVDGNVTVLNEHALRLDGGRLELQKLGEGTPDWALRIEGETLQFIEPDDGDRVVFEVLDVSTDINAPAIRLHGETDATLSAAQVIDLTDGDDTTLHTHPGATTLEKGMVEIATAGETGTLGQSGARLVLPADDTRILTQTQKDDLTDGGLTTLHRHPNGILNNFRTVALQADDSTDIAAIDLGVTMRVVAFIHMRAVDPRADFDSGDGLFADIHRVDGVRPPGAYWFDGDHLGADGSDSNLLPAVYAGLARTITFRLRSTQDAAVWAEGVVFFENP